MWNKIRRFPGVAFRLFVGSEYGFTAEGNQQWYYTIALAISNILAWTYLPKCALIFTILSAIHLISVHLYGFNDWGFEERKYSVWYLVTHGIIFVVALFANWWWTILSSLILIAAYYIAPDCSGNNIFMKNPHSNGSEIAILFFNTLLMAIFIGVVSLLPTAKWIKIAIVVVAIILHPFIDMFACESVVINDTIEEAFDIVLNGDRYTQCEKNMEKDDNFS